MPSRSVESTYLVEHYRPGLTAEELEHCVIGIQDALRGLEGPGAARYLGSVAVPADEEFLVVVGAESEQEVRKTYQRIGTTFDRISVAVADLGPPRRVHGDSAPSGVGAPARPSPHHESSSNLRKGTTP